MNSKLYQLNIAWLYPDLMSTYGDRGNIIVLTKRCQWRGIRVNLLEVTLETKAEILKQADLLFMGGAQDRQQKLAYEDFLKNKSPIVKELIDKEIPGLFVCAAYQLLGKFYRPYQGKDIPGAGIVDLETIHPGDQKKRLIGNVVAKPNSQITISNSQFNSIVGFENHGGRTKLGIDVKPLGTVTKGYGNNDEDEGEGVLYKSTIGSYFHGPILTKNPRLADWLILKALEVKYKKEVELEQLDDELEWKAHRAVL